VNNLSCSVGTTFVWIEFDFHIFELMALSRSKLHCLLRSTSIFHRAVYSGPEHLPDYSRKDCKTITVLA